MYMYMYIYIYIHIYIYIYTTWARTHLEHLDGGGSAEDLEEGKPDKHLPHGALGDRSVVELGELEVARVDGLGAGELVHVLDDAAEGGEHGNTAVLELRLAQPVSLFTAQAVY